MIKPEEMLKGKNIAIVGAGIIGACCAAHLSACGANVTVFDRAMPGQAGPSRGNAAHIAASAIFPLAAPGIIFDALPMLLDPKAPLKMPPGQWPKLMPWLISFMLNARKKTYQANINKLGEFNQNAYRDSEQLYQAAGLSGHLHRDGALYLYESGTSLDKSHQEFATREKFGFDCHRLSAEQIYDLEPGLAKIFSGGYLIPGWMTVSDPQKIVSGLMDYCYKLGGQFNCEDISAITSVRQGVKVSFANGNSAGFDQVIVAAGVSSRPLVKKLGQKKLLTAERGYNLTYTRPGIAINRAIMFADRGVVATRVDDGLRIGGWAELVSDDIPVNQDYFTRINDIARELFPALDSAEHYPWMGARPSTPDSLPVIERSEADANVVYAFGHGHLGLTQGPTTAKKVAQLLVPG
ncbi:NAD(P)/FAD-dependent oxidoreductase [Thalassomonas haliotis]|uniref:FAD-binding oxidoreductase n=1 Tax=Thalassomonas haliotis TaxID=485448 RepID=A0ABY7V964_9GAMM|nr:FAD-binding oxidoreductase [Thalassomonas haliotis]WDE10175.1 FAD-binding oxidoreductase [Thalassomonas haliotis]